MHADSTTARRAPGAPIDMRSAPPTLFSSCREIRQELVARCAAHGHGCRLGRSSTPSLGAGGRCRPVRARPAEPRSAPPGRGRAAARHSPRRTRAPIAAPCGRRARSASREPAHGHDRPVGDVAQCFELGARRARDHVAEARNGRAFPRFGSATLPRTAREHRVTDNRRACDQHRQTL